MGIYKLIYKNEIYPNHNIIDSFSYKILLTFKYKNNYIELFYFVLFAYTISIFIGYSLKSIELSLKLYNEIKINLLLKKYNIFKIIKNLFIKEFLTHEKQINIIYIYKKKIIIHFD